MWLIHIGFYGLIFVNYNTNQVTQNLTRKLRQNSITSEKQGYLSEKLKALTSSNYNRV